jgi:hypothetical protein
MHKTWQHCVLFNTNPVPACPVSAISITNKTAAVPPAMHAVTFTNMERRVFMCFQTEGKKFSTCCIKIISTSTKVYTRQGSFSLVNYLLIHNY